MAGQGDCGDLQLDSDVALQERMWKVERVAWLLLGLIVLAALAGAFGGGGFLSSAHYQAPAGTFSLEYRRLTRHSTQTTLSYRLSPGQSELWLSNQFLQGVTIEWIAPEPEQTARDDARTVFRFDSLTPDRPLEVEFHVRPSGFGPLELETGTPAGSSARLRSFVYP